VPLSLVITRGSYGTLEMQPIPWAASNRMLGGYAACTAMSWSGVKIGMEITRVVV